MNMQFLSRLTCLRLATALMVVLSVLCVTREARAQRLLIVSAGCSGSQTGAGPFDVAHPLDGAGPILNGEKSLLGNSGQLVSIYQRFTDNPYYPSRPPRTIDALVLSIGGNDIGFANIVEF